jgi:twitching motility protein PilT
MTRPRPRARGRGRVMACEVLVISPAIRALIRDDKVHQVYSMMQSGKKFGMQTLNDALYQLYVAREVTEDECLRVSSDPNEFLRMIGRTMVEDESAADQRAARAAAGGTRR